MRLPYNNSTNMSNMAFVIELLLPKVGRLVGTQPLLMLCRGAKLKLKVNILYNANAFFRPRILAFCSEEANGKVHGTT